MDEVNKTRGTVLFLSHDASRTGAPIILLRFLRWFSANRNLPFRILVGKKGDIIGEFEEIAATDLLEPERALRYRVQRRLKLHHHYLSSYQARLREVLANMDIRLIYANSIASASLLKFFPFIRCPVVCHVHELEGMIQTLGSEHLDILEQINAQYIAVSNAVRKNLIESHGVSPDRIRVIHGFVPCAESEKTTLDGAPNSMRQILGIPDSSKVICACGTIEYRKGPDIFLQVAEQVIQRYRTHPVHFIWIGGNSGTVNEMRRLVANSALRDVVHFVGSTSVVAPYFQDSDVFILTSREDPFPLVVMEAGLNRIPIVCFADAGGAPEFVEEDAGFVIPDFNVHKMADSIVELLLSPTLRNKMGMAAREKVIQRHDLRIGAAKIAAFLEDTMRNRRTDGFNLAHVRDVSSNR